MVNVFTLCHFPVWDFPHRSSLLCLSSPFSCTVPSPPQDFAPPQDVGLPQDFGRPEVRTQKKITGLFGNFSHRGGEGLPNSQNFCKLTKCFFACQIHSEVLKHVLQRGGGDIWSILSPKVHLISFILEKKNGSFGNLWGEGGVPYSQK